MEWLMDNWEAVVGLLLLVGGAAAGQVTGTWGRVLQLALVAGRAAVDLFGRKPAEPPRVVDAQDVTRTEAQEHLERKPE